MEARRQFGMDLLPMPEGELPMSRKKLSRNAPCPCGSGKKYKHCCYRKDFDWLEDDEGSIFKSMPLSAKLKYVEQSLTQNGEVPPFRLPEQTLIRLRTSGNC
jgi:hypothetical protein